MGSAADAHEALESEVNRLGLDLAIDTLGFTGERDYEALVVAFEEADDATRQQVLNRLRMTR